MTGSGVLIWAEAAGRGVSANSLELLAPARQLADAWGGEVAAVLSASGGSAGPLAEALIQRGADRVFMAGGDGNGDEQRATAERALAACSAAVGRAAPAVILLPHSDCGAELAPRLACRLNSAAAMGCVATEVDGSGVAFIRPCYGGKAHARVRISTNPAIATVRPKAFQAPDADGGRHGEVVALEADEPARTPRVRVVGLQLAEERGPRLDDAEIVITGGRGVGGPEGFRMLEALAETLGGAVGASRPVCDLGWCPRSQQVGLSGRTIAPQLYLAVGVSGAQHHMAGCGNSKVLVAVNIDPDSDIFAQAHIGVVADCRAFVPALMQALHDRAEPMRGTPASSI